MITMKLFDCYAMFGELSLGPPRYARNAEELVSVMELLRHSGGVGLPQFDEVREPRDRQPSGDS